MNRETSHRPALHGGDGAPDVDEALGLIAQGTAPVTGDEFFRSLVRSLATVLRVDVAFLAELLEGGTRVRTLASWEKGRFKPSIEFDLAPTPCRDVVAGHFTHYEHSVRSQFPGDTYLAREGIESYLGVPLRDRDDRATLGHLAIMDVKPFAVDPRSLRILEIFAARARAELERMHFEHRLGASEQHLALVLGSAMDAVVTVDEGWSITLFNEAAERMFDCPRETALERGFEPFLSGGFRDFFSAYVRDYAEAGSRRRQLWAPSGLTLRRADASEFPVEATVSPLVHGQRSLFTLILRDVNDRQEAERALKRLTSERRYLESELREITTPGSIIGRSRPVRAMLELIDQVAATDSTVLVTGETGTGKELIAQAIHDRSARRQQLLVKLNCATLPRELVESELFGHEKGAFTGATQQKKGRFELAHRGTLLLDEIGELDPATQAKLLRVLQEQEFERVGGTETIRVDVRVIAATNRDLSELVGKGGFRTDLFYRLNVFPIRAPALRERPGDIELIVEALIEHFRRVMGKPLQRVSETSLARLTAYSWPGNVRELRNVIERAAILATGPVLEVGELSAPRTAPAAALPAGTLEEVERAYISEVLERSGWVIEGRRGAANTLGLHPNTLRARMGKLGIRRPTSPPVKH